MGRYVECVERPCSSSNLVYLLVLASTDEWITPSLFLHLLVGITLQTRAFPPPIYVFVCVGVNPRIFILSSESWSITINIYFDGQILTDGAKAAVLAPDSLC